MAPCADHYWLLFHVLGLCGRFPFLSAAVVVVCSWVAVLPTALLLHINCRGELTQDKTRHRYGFMIHPYK